MDLELVTVGTELLLGFTLDTNGAEIARRLSAAGIRVVRRTAVGDRADEIREAELERARPRLRTLSDEERREVETLTAQIVNKLLHEPTVRVKEAASEGAEEYAAALRALFALDEERA